MRTDDRIFAGSAVAVFFFGHQDDEFGVYFQIGLERAKGRRIVCAYLTSGVPAGADAARRNGESLAVLAKLGVRAEDVVFAGGRLGIPDGRLIDHLSLASGWMAPWLASLGEIAAVYLPAWEGGHPDHDALHAVALRLCAEAGIERRVWQFPLYHADGCPGQLFRVLAPLEANGEVSRARIPWAQRPAFLRYSLSYPSQKMSWVGLFPFFLLHLLFCGEQALQRAELRRIGERPHAGDLYYEKRRFSSWPEVHARLGAWLSGRSGA